MSERQPIPRGRFLTGTQIEVLHEPLLRGRIRSALFDFDGTISLIRTGWQEVMVPMMVEVLLAETPTRESPAELERIVRDFVDRLTGKQTIYQMIQLAEEITRRGGQPRDPLAYKHEYHDRLLARIDWRREGLRRGEIDPRELVVPGSLEMLSALCDRGVTLYLASGTDLHYVQEEADLLGVTRFFAGGIFGALDQYEKFSKAMVIDHILQTYHLRGEQLVAFGDGFVEIENTKAVGGIAVGVASEEEKRQGINEWKRRRLIGAGADLIIPDFREHERLVAYLWAEE